MYEKSSPDIDRLSFAFGELSVFDDKSYQREVVVDEKQLPGPSNVNGENL